ncbi:MAG: N-acetylmuramic acid 6-phosphate etherase [Balneolaceae bacterium]|nr:N-acetylmuramic acid 6-phosphate etherase [Balneolaceae bacterium]
MTIVKSNPELFRKLEKLLTEQRNPASREIDLADSREIVRIINDEDKKVAEAVETRLDVIADAVDAIVEGFKQGGRLLYFGAGTSGRLGVLDAAECPPTFGTDPELVQGFIAGGEKAMFRAQEGAEDVEQYGAEEINRLKVNSVDVIAGLAASGRTPYVHGALKRASEIGCKTILVTTVSAEQVDLDVDYMVDVPVGPEVIMGSTRMKSATAQKMILNMFTTGAMIRLGKVYENVMVDLQLTNKKLEERAKRIVMMLAKINYEEAEEMLDKADDHVKTALLMALSGLSKDEAIRKLQESDGFIRKVLKKL